MASIEQIRKAIARTIAQNVDFELHTYEYVEEMAHTPALIVEPEIGDFEITLNRGLDEWLFRIFVIVGRSNGGQSQRILDRMVDGDGPNSVRRIIYDHPDLGLGDGTDAHVFRMKGYGGSYQYSKIPHVGAVIQIKVRTDPRER
jgi:hypothetical protein